MAFIWDEMAGSFRGEKGRFVSQSAVRAVVDKVADQASARLAAASEALLRNEMSLATWQATSMATIRQAHVAAAVIAHGGAEQMTFSRYGSAGAEIKAQYQYMRTMAEQIADGSQPLNGSLTVRARQYGQASRVTFERAYGRDQMGRGNQWERNVLAPAEHCAQCREQTSRGLVPIGTLVPVGQRSCRSNCRCRIAYERTNEAAQAA